MGQRIAGRLLDGKLEVSVYDVAADKARALAGRGAHPAGSPKEAAQDADAAITMVTDGPAVLAVLSGPEGLLAGASPGLLYVDMSTIGVEDSKRVAAACDAAGVRYVRAPVLGTLPAVEAGQLTALVSGPREAVDEAAHLLAHLCGQQHYMGSAEEGRVAKLIVNGLLAAGLASLAEGLVVGQKLGLDWQKLLEVVGGGAMASPAIKGSAQAIGQRNFEPRLSVDLLAKDLRLLAEAAMLAGATVPIASAALPLYQSAANMGWGHLDTSAVFLLLETLAGKTVSE